MTTKSQSERILRHLGSGKKLTPIQALEEFGCFRLAARIHDLREQGYRIETENANSNGKRIVRYVMP